MHWMSYPTLPTSRFGVGAKPRARVPPLQAWFGEFSPRRVPCTVVQLARTSGACLSTCGAYTYLPTRKLDLAVWRCLRPLGSYEPPPESEMDRLVMHAPLESVAGGTRTSSTSTNLVCSSYLRWRPRHSSARPNRNVSLEKFWLRVKTTGAAEGR